MTVDSQERDRPRRLVRAHLASENRHDLDGVMNTFAERTEMVYNRQSFKNHDDIRGAHIHIGISFKGGALTGAEVVTDAESFTDEEIVIEGRLCGTHDGKFRGNEPTHREVELPFVTFYKFDRGGKLTSERVVMDFSALKP